MYTHSSNNYMNIFRCFENSTISITVSSYNAQIKACGLVHSAKSLWISSLSQSTLITYYVEEIVLEKNLNEQNNIIH